MAVAVAVAVAVGCCSPVVVGWVPSTIVVGLLVYSLRAGDSSAGVPVGSPTTAESNVERVMATTIAPKSITGASAAVRGNSAHGESPA